MDTPDLIWLVDPETRAKAIATGEEQVIGIVIGQQTPMRADPDDPERRYYYLLSFGLSLQVDRLVSSWFCFKVEATRE